MKKPEEEISEIISNRDRVIAAIPHFPKGLLARIVALTPGARVETTHTDPAGIASAADSLLGYLDNRFPDHKYGVIYSSAIGTTNIVVTDNESSSVSLITDSGVI